MDIFFSQSLNVPDTENILETCKLDNNGIEKNAVF